MMQWLPSEEQIAAASAVLLAQAAVDTIRPVVEQYQKAILAKHRWPVARQWVELGEADCIILEPKESYLLEDEHLAQYCNECNQARIAANFHVEQNGCCPLLVAESLLIEAKTALCAAMTSVTKLTAEQLLCAGIEKRDEYVRFTLQLLAPYVRDAGRRQATMRS